ncbi:MAG TPA: M20/M25/M40 family metallo-hydrolase [Puia sp.]|nr:M20/M25/M40 family metallo-hydrolase [Puia sp.]
MFKKIVRWLGIALFLFILFLFFNMYRAKPWPASTAVVALRSLPDSAIRHMSQAIQIPTIAISDSAALDSAAFQAFGVFLEQAYPLVHQHLTRTCIRRFSYVFEWKGQRPELAPLILMGHYDVVPVEATTAAEWARPPFSGAITDSCIWGRGAIDDKDGVIAILEAAEALLRKGFVPARTLYFCFGHDEEIRGPSASWVVDYLKQQGIHPEMVLDEGGEISGSKTKELGRPLAVIGVEEKGHVSFELSVDKEGGHSSLPAKETAIDILNTALYRLKNSPPPARLTAPVKEFIGRIGSSSDNLGHRLAATNLWLFEGVVKKILSDQPEGYALTHTTIVPTILEAGVKSNVIPSKARAIVNCRLLPGETIESTARFIQETLHDPRVVVREIGLLPSEPSAVTDTASPAFRRLVSAVSKTVLNVLPAPYLMVGGTDSRFYRRISDGVVNFFPMTDGMGAHGINERLPIIDLQRGIHMMNVLIEESGREFQ